MTTLTRGALAQMDAEDPLRGLRDAFELRDGLLYLDGNSLGALPRATASRLQDTVRGDWGEGLITSWLDAGWKDAPQRIGDKIAALIGAADGEVIAADSTSVNIFKALCAALQINRGRHVIVTERGNFPTDAYMMQGLAAFHSDLEARLAAPEDVLDQLDDSVAALLLTQVHYKTGRIHDVARITRQAHQHGVLVIWDLSHSTGAIEVDLNGAGADFAVGCGYKFLNGGPGAPGYLFVALRHQPHIHPVLAGWFGHREPFAFDDTYAPADDIRRFQCGTPPVLGLVGLECGVDMFNRVDMAEVRRKSMNLGAAFIRLMRERCAGLGFALASPEADEQRGGHVSYRHDQGYAILQALKARSLIGDFRAPDIMRFGMTSLYLRYQDIYDAVEIIHDVMAKRAWDRPEYRVRAAVT
jgi:kynureninase